MDCHCALEKQPEKADQFLVNVKFNNLFSIHDEKPRLVTWGIKPVLSEQVTCVHA